MPIFTYRCLQGHEWDEVRYDEDTARSEDPCADCRTGEHGDKIMSQVSVHLHGRGFTPTFYPNREHK